MTDEEIAEEYAGKYFGKKTELVEVWKVKSCKENFLAGLKAGKPHWHYLIQKKRKKTVKNITKTMIGV